MKIKIIKTEALYLTIIKDKPANKLEWFCQEVIEPFDLMFKTIGMPKDPNLLNYLSLDYLKKDMKGLDVLEQVNSKVESEIDILAKRFVESGFNLPEELLIAVILGDSDKLKASGGYTGFGGVPGYIQVIVPADTLDVNKALACLVHEFHHNVLFNNVTWPFMNVTVSQYLALEGLAESFVHEVYGQSYIGPWVTTSTIESIEKAKKIIGKNLDVEGFMNARKYIFGDHPMLSEEERIGLPYCAGYATGYYAIQAYQSNNGKHVIETTKDFVNGKDIVKESGYFE